MRDQRRDGDGVHARGPARLARGGFPDARFALLVGPGELLEFEPFGFRGGEGVHGGDFGALRHVVGGVGAGRGAEVGGLGACWEAVGAGGEGAAEWEGE